MERILILDFGSQYTMLIARRIREMNVYCDIVPFNKIPAITPDIKGIVLSGYRKIFDTVSCKDPVLHSVIINIEMPVMTKYPMR